MPDTLSIGPFSVPMMFAAVLVGVFVSLVLAALLARRADAPVGVCVRVLMLAVLAAVLGARAAHVLTNWLAYSERPYSALNFWQPGYAAGYGVALGVAVALLLLRRLPMAVRVRSLRALVTASVGGATLATALFAALFTLVPVAGDVGVRVPDFVLEDGDGRRVGAADLAGGPVVLNFWATWCPPCRREMPLLDEVAGAYASRGLRVVGIDLGETREAVRRFTARVDVRYPLWTDAPGVDRDKGSQALFARLGGAGLPTTWFIAADGRIAGRVIGELSREVLLAWAERLVTER